MDDQEIRGFLAQVERGQQNSEGKKPIILVVEDELHSIQWYIAVLEEKYYIKAAYTKKVAMEVLKNNEVKLVILDLKLPHDSGEDILKEIKKRFSSIPVIICSGRDEIPDLKVEAVLSKWEMYEEHLLEVIKKIAKKKRRKE